jgi:hypothetical protein
LPLGARELSDRRAEGQFHGYLGALYARIGRTDDARHHLATGEALLAEVSDRLSLALLLCQRAQAERLAGDVDVARSLLLDAHRLALELDVGSNSDLARRLAALRTADAPEWGQSPHAAAAPAR